MILLCLCFLLYIYCFFSILMNAFAVEIRCSTEKKHVTNILKYSAIS